MHEPRTVTGRSSAHHNHMTVEKWQPRGFDMCSWPEKRSPSCQSIKSIHSWTSGMPRHESIRHGAKKNFTDPFNIVINVFLSRKYLGWILKLYQNDIHYIKMTIFYVTIKKYWSADCSWGERYLQWDSELKSILSKINTSRESRWIRLFGWAVGAGMAGNWS